MHPSVRRTTDVFKERSFDENSSESSSGCGKLQGKRKKRIATIHRRFHNRKNYRRAHGSDHSVLERTNISLFVHGERRRRLDGSSYDPSTVTPLFLVFDGITNEKGKLVLDFKYPHAKYSFNYQVALASLRLHVNTMENAREDQAYFQFKLIFKFRVDIGFCMSLVSSKLLEVGLDSYLKNPLL